MKKMTRMIQEGKLKYQEKSPKLKIGIQVSVTATSLETMVVSKASLICF